MSWDLFIVLPIQTRRVNMFLSGFAFNGRYGQQMTATPIPKKATLVLD